MSEPNPGRRKALVLFETTAPSSELAPAVEAMSRRADERLAGAGWTRALLRLDDDPLAPLFGAGRPSFGAVLEVGAHDAARAPEVLANALAGIAEDAGGLVDPGRSTVVAGTERVVVAGSATNQLLFLMRAKEGMTVEAFHDYWLNVHAVHHAHLDGVAGYGQLHADGALSRSLGAAAGLGGGSYDGIAESFMDVVAGLGGGRPEGRGDRENFVDAASELGIVARVVASTEERGVR